ncbi:MAG TPA: response regulator, partial [Candidatus Wallbacteria bacterium]|nr:response regulator [Candidatus Wallbacteria bacterium]
MKNEKLKILLIDDDDILVEGLTRALESAGFSVESLGSIKEAAKRLGPDYKQADFDVIILDILLPDGLGFDLLKKIRSFGCTVPVIILSSQNNELDKISGLDIGADDYICKPFSLLELK